jgi:hypothetical protein
MANEKSTANLLKAQVKLLGAFQSSELRYTYPATYLALKAMTPIMFPDYMELKTRDDRAIEPNFITRASRNLNSVAGRTHNHSGVKQDSAVATLSWTTYTDKFNMSLKQADKNLYSAEEQLFNEISNSVSNFVEGLEDVAITTLWNNRTQLASVAVAEAPFNTGASKKTFEISEAAAGTRAMQITKIAIQANKYPSGCTIFCDSIAYAKFEYQAAQGATNSTNLSFQFNGVTFVHSVGLYAKVSPSLSLYTRGYWLVVPNGTAAVLPWIPKQNRIGVDTPVGSYSNIINPIDGESYAVHTYMTAADDSANNGYTQDVVTQYEISQDVAIAIAPLSVATTSPILGFALIA